MNTSGTSLPKRINKAQLLKNAYIEYFSDVPIQKYAAMAIGRDEDTIIRWRKTDAKFADAVLRAKAEWVRKRFITTKAEFALERLEKEIFSPHTTIELTKPIDIMPEDPNTPANRKLVDEITELMMERTKLKNI